MSMIRRTFDGNIDLGELCCIASAFYLAGLAIFGLFLGLLNHNLMIGGITIGAGLGAFGLVVAMIAGIMGLNRYG